jgi:hypothetical protein
VWSSRYLGKEDTYSVMEKMYSGNRVFYLSFPFFFSFSFPFLSFPFLSFLSPARGKRQKARVGAIDHTSQRSKRPHSILVFDLTTQKTNPLTSHPPFSSLQPLPQTPHSRLEHREASALLFYTPPSPPSTPHHLPALS